MVPFIFSDVVEKKYENYFCNHEDPREEIRLIICYTTY